MEELEKKQAENGTSQMEQGGEKQSEVGHVEQQLQEENEKADELAERMQNVMNKARKQENEFPWIKAVTRKNDQQNERHGMYEEDDEEDDRTNDRDTTAKIYVGNIPPNTNVNNIKSLFDAYILKVEDITITKTMHKPTQQERAMYATFITKEKNVEEILDYNGIMVEGKNICVELIDKKHFVDRKNIDCRFYLNGHCKKGNNCDFIHRQVCTHHQRFGNCKFGERCRNAHINKQSEPKSDDFMQGVLKLLMTQRLPPRRAPSK